MIPPEHKQAHEVQLTGWGEGMKTGPWVKFRVDKEAYEHFKQFNSEGKNQQRFHLVAVPIDDNEEPLQTKPKKRFDEMSRAQQAGILCDDERFQGWLCEGFPGSGPEFTARLVRLDCHVNSRADINTDELAIKKWDALVARYREETQMAERR